MIIHLLLEDLISPDNKVRNEAEQSLEQFFDQDYRRFILELFDYYSSEEFDDNKRKLAGLTIKNSFVSRERKGSLQINRLNKWCQQPTEFKLNVKERALNILNFQTPSLSTTSSQIVSSLAFLEFSKSPWNELLPFLFEGTNKENPFLKINCIETLGFLAEILDPHHLVPFANQILTIIVGNMKAPGPGSDYGSLEFRLSITSCRAFINSFTFIDSNFKNTHERNYIMTTILTLATSFLVNQAEPYIELTYIAWEALVKTIQYYYPYVASYFFDSNVIGLIIKAISCDIEPVNFQSIELLSNIGEIESDLLLSPREEMMCENIIRTIFGQIIFHLLERLIHPQNKSGIESDEWTPQMAASTCLSHMIPCVGAEIVNYSLVINFIDSGLTSSLWNHREASIMVLGSILEIEDKKSLDSLVLVYLPKLAKALSNDDSYLVKDSASWVLGKIFDFYHYLIPIETLPQLLDLLLDNIMHSKGELATNCCWALMNLVMQYGDEVSEDEISSSSDSAPITDSFLKNILSSLISSLKRGDLFSSNLFSALFQALFNIICCVIGKNLEIIRDFLIFVLGQLDSCSFISQSDDRIHNSQFINGFYLLCQGCFKKLGSKKCYEITEYFNSINTKLFNEYGNYIIEEMFPAIFVWFSKLQKTEANCLSSLISQYFPLIQKILLSSIDDSSASLLTLNFLDDLIQNFHEELHLCGIDTLLITASQLYMSDQADIVLKIKLVSCIGDVALFLKPVFENNEKFLIEYVHHALSFSSRNILLIGNDDKFGTLLEDIFQALSCIFGSSTEKDLKTIRLGYVPNVFNFLETIITSVPEILSDSLFNQMINLIYDLVQIFGKNLRSLENHNLIKFINEKQDLPEEFEKMRYFVNNQMLNK